MDTIERKDVLVWIVDDVHVAVAPPLPTESKGLVGTKMFIIACLHRLVQDEDFGEEMSGWANDLDQEKLKETFKTLTVARH